MQIGRSILVKLPNELIITLSGVSTDIKVILSPILAFGLIYSCLNYRYSIKINLIRIMHVYLLIKIDKFAKTSFYRSNEIIICYNKN